MGGWRTRSRSTPSAGWVQQEDYALRVCRDAGLPSPAPYGFVELTPEREYLLVRDGRMQLIDVAFIEARPTPGARPSTWPT